MALLPFLKGERLLPLPLLRLRLRLHLRLALRDLLGLLGEERGGHGREAGEQLGLSRLGRRVLRLRHRLDGAGHDPSHDLVDDRLRLCLLRRCHGQARAAAAYRSLHRGRGRILDQG